MCDCVCDIFHISMLSPGFGSKVKIVQFYSCVANPPAQTRIGKRFAQNAGLLPVFFCQFACLYEVLRVMNVAKLP